MLVIIVILVRNCYLINKVKFVNLSRQLNTLPRMTGIEPDREEAGRPVGEDVVANGNRDEFGWES